jgi:redox-sensitive bicupin YhaK (pirin superfamily)
LEPGYEQKNFPKAELQGKLRVVASRDGADGAVVVHQDVKLLAGHFAEGEQEKYTLAPGRQAWLHVARGSVRVNGQALEAGDALQASEEAALEISGVQNAEVLLFDLA